MCYTGQCPHESFNPITGNCHCRRGKNPCPMEDELCEECQAILTNEERETSLEKTEGEFQLCSECLAENLIK